MCICTQQRVLTQHNGCRQSALMLQAVHATVASELRAIMQYHKCDEILSSAFTNHTLHLHKTNVLPSASHSSRFGCQSC